MKKRVRPYPSFLGLGRNLSESCNSRSQLDLQVQMCRVNQAGSRNMKVDSANKLFFKSAEKLPTYQEHFIPCFGSLKRNSSINSIKT